MSIPTSLPTDLGVLRDTLSLMDAGELDTLGQALLAMQEELAAAQVRRSRIPLGGLWHRIPHYIRSSIFELCVLSEDWTLRSTTTMTLSLVCKDWQEDALWTPRIWGNVVVRNSTWRVFHLSLVRAMLWLARSKAAPARIHLSLPPHTWYLAADELAEATNLIIVNLHHCQQLVIVVPEGNRVPDGLSCLREPAPMLSVCSIVLEKETEEQGDVKLSQASANTLFSNCSPCLTTMTLPSLNIHWPISALGHLTTLRISNCGAASLHSLLTAFDPSLLKLKTLEISGFTISRTEISTRLNSPIIVNSSITHLTLHGHHLDDATTLLGKLDLLALHHLTVDNSQTNPPNSTTPVFQAQFPSIHTLTLGKGIQNGAGLRDLIGRMLSLRAVDIYDLATLDIFIDKYGTPGVMVCPCLVTVLCMPEPDLSDIWGFSRDLMWLLMNRKENDCAALESLTVPVLGSYQEDFERDLRVVSPDTKITNQFDAAWGFKPKVSDQRRRR